MKNELSLQTIEIIKNTGDVVVGNSTKITTRMYELLFDKYPHVKELFVNKPENQYMKLAESLSLFVVNIEKINVLKPALEVIANTHVQTNVQKGHYPMVGLSLINAMEDVLKERATIEFVDAWREAYKFLADILIEMEEKMYKEIVN